ncbi:MAG: UvrD-helicase domain-containing protein, partial [Candidatus Cryptobacteroides sp.]
YQHFLLDEFQDTSVVQWENFRPLMANSLSGGYKNIIVGDIKQSIYRFRNSYWKLLAKKVGEDFPGAIAERPLTENWRSCAEIVNFNNSFFTKAAEFLGKSEIYKDVVQSVRKEDKQRGYITVDYCDEQLEECYDYVLDAMSRGAKPSDICILVRGRNEGSKVAQKLLENNISVISDDSLRLKSSLLIRRVVALLYCMISEDNSIEQYLARSIDVDLKYEYHSLVDLCEYLFRALRENNEKAFDSQTLFVQSFMDDVLNFTQTKGNDLHQFLKHWEESDILVSSPDDPYAVRIMTIHKSKGLSAPVIIFPFAEKVGLYRAQTKWCVLDEPQAMGEGFDIPYPINLEDKCSLTYFENSYKEERDLQIVDNLNLFYVCCTRAEKEMHIIAKPAPKTLLDKGEPKDMSQLLFVCLLLNNQLAHYSQGEPYDFHLQEKKKSVIQAFPAKYQSYPMNPEENPKRFVASTEAWDFFGSEGIANSRRLNGIRLHKLLSMIVSLKDMDRVLSDASAEEQEFLKTAILSHKEWFDEELKCLNEASIINSFGEFHRPDRVLVDKAGRVQIIDFKFGEPQEKYHSQIRRYVKLFQEMGYEQVRGFLWYVSEGQVEEI